MSKKEATSEVSARLAAPGQGLSYVTGKLELYRYLQAAAAAAAANHTVTGTPRRGAVGTFDVADFHASLLSNGNLPVALQMHAAGVVAPDDGGAPPVDPAFVNLHTSFEGVPPARIRLLSDDPTRVRWLPRTPPGSAPAMFTGCANIRFSVSRVLANHRMCVHVHECRLVDVACLLVDVACLLVDVACLLVDFNTCCESCVDTLEDHFLALCKHPVTCKDDGFRRMEAKQLTAE
jgi:hypothetical protein